MELAELPWRKSSYSMGNGGNCVEVAKTERVVFVRDSKDPQGPALMFRREQWHTFLGTIRHGGPEHRLTRGF